MRRAASFFIRRKTLFILSLFVPSDVFDFGRHWVYRIMSMGNGLHRRLLFGTWGVSISVHLDWIGWIKEKSSGSCDGLASLLTYSLWGSTGGFALRSMGWVEQDWDSCNTKLYPTISKKQILQIIHNGSSLCLINLPTSRSSVLHLGPSTIV
ncbi:hypothetical protein LX36DRAFT_276486 [Colletotrichum falcatum]|nr:hypothetical protein LX36DRAFT_276486 [Colletotrichum falcatum]